MGHSPLRHYRLTLGLSLCIVVGFGLLVGLILGSQLPCAFDTLVLVGK